MKPTTEYTTTEKLEALKAYLIETGEFSTEEAEELEWMENWETFAAYGYEYKVLTDEEADEATRESILESLWAFRARFIVEHTKFYENSTHGEDEAFCKALEELQQSICESANPIVYALIKDIDEFVEDAIDADGRGNFLSTYDGEENESACGKFYIYRIN